MAGRMERGKEGRDGGRDVEVVESRERRTRNSVVGERLSVGGAGVRKMDRLMELCGAYGTSGRTGRLCRADGKALRKGTAAGAQDEEEEEERGRAWWS